MVGGAHAATVWSDVMAGCPDNQTLLALARGELPAEQAAATDNHVEQCRRCAKTLAALDVDADLVAEIRDLEQARAELGSALAGLREVEERISTTLFGGAAPRA
jgi:anti-sigma factor RsiW